MTAHGAIVRGLLDPLAGGLEIVFEGQTFLEQVESGGSPVAGANDADVGTFGGIDQFVSEKRHVLILEGAFEVLIVSAFIGFEGAGFGWSDRSAGNGMKDRATHGVGIGAGDFANGATSFGDHGIEMIVLAVGSAGDAAEIVFVAGQDGAGFGPDGSAVLVKGEFIEDKIARETAGGERIGGENDDASSATVHGDAGFAFHVFETIIAAEIDLLEGAAHETADFSAFTVEFDAVHDGVGKDGDGPAGNGDETIDGPGGESERFSHLPGPKPEFDAGGAVEESLPLIGTELDQRLRWRDDNELRRRHLQG